MQRKHLWITTLITTILLLSTQGCTNATHAKFKNKYDSWIGKNITYFIKAVGYPDSTFILPNKNKVYVYEKSEIRSATTTIGIGYGHGGYGQIGGGIFGYPIGGDVVQERCKLFIETDRKGKILKWQSRGNHCVEK